MRRFVIISFAGVLAWLVCRHYIRAPRDAGQLATCQTGCAGVLIVEPLPIGSGVGQADPVTVVSDDGGIACSNEPAGPHRCRATYVANASVVLRFSGERPDDWQWYSSCGMPLNQPADYEFSFAGDRIIRVWTGK